MMNSNNPGPSAPNRIQAVRNLAALVQDAARQQEPDPHITRVYNALVALQDPRLHNQWNVLIQKVTSTRQAARDSAQQAELARQQGQPPNVQQFERNRARVMAEDANNALREQAQFEEDVFRRYQESFAQFIELQGAPANHPMAPVGHQNVRRIDANPNVPPPAQDTIAQRLANIQYLYEVNEIRAQQQGEKISAALRATDQRAAVLRDNERKIMELLYEIRDENRGGRRVVVAQTPVRVGAPAGPDSRADQDRARFKQMVISGHQAATAQSLHQQQKAVRHIPKPAPVNLPLPVTAQDTNRFKLKIIRPLQAGAAPTGSSVADRAKHEAAQFMRAAALAVQQDEPEEVQNNLSLVARAAAERADRADQDRDRFKQMVISAHQTATAQSLHHQQQAVTHLPKPTPVNLPLPVTQNPTSSTAQNGGAQVALGTPAVSNGGPIRLAIRKTRRGPRKQDVEHKGKVVGKGQTRDPITGLYTHFVCTTISCQYTTEDRRKMRDHSKIHNSK